MPAHEIFYIPEWLCTIVIAWALAPSSYKQEKIHNRIHMHRADTGTFCIAYFDLECSALGAPRKTLEKQIMLKV